MSCAPISYLGIYFKMASGAHMDEVVIYSQSHRHNNRNGNKVYLCAFTKWSHLFTKAPTYQRPAHFPKVKCLGMEKLLRKATFFTGKCKSTEGFQEPILARLVSALKSPTPRDSAIIPRGCSLRNEWMVHTAFCQHLSQSKTAGDWWIYGTINT